MCSSLLGSIVSSSTEGRLIPIRRDIKAGADQGIAGRGIEGEGVLKAVHDLINGRLRDEFLNKTLFTSLMHARLAPQEWHPDCNRASHHPSVYVIEEKRLCWSGCDPVGYLGCCRARSAIALADDVERAPRLKIQGPSGKG
jgi:hypothetical protein